MLKLSFVIEAIDRATAPVRAINQRIEKMTEPVTKIRASFNSLLRESHLPRLAEQAREVGKRFEGVTGALRGIAGAAFIVAGAGAAMWFPLKSVIDAGSKVNDTAAMLGISAREFQRVAYALTLDGSSAEDAATALRFLQKNAVEAISGSKEMQLWFRRAGMSSAFLQKNLNNPIALLEAMSDAMAKLPTPAQKIALSQALLNRGGSRLAQTLSRGSAELRRLGDEAEALGAVMDDKTVASMDDAGDSVTRMERAVGGLFDRITAAALPAVERIVANVTRWTVANRELIASRVAEFAERLVQRLPEIADTTFRVLAALGALIGVADRVAQFFGGWEIVLEGFAAVMGLKLVASILQLGVALAGLIPIIAQFGAVLLFTPVGWFLGAVAAIAGAAFLIYKYWEPIKQFFVDLWEGVKNAIVKLDAMTPDWVKRFTLPGAALKLAADAVRPAGAAPSAIAQGGASRNDVSGTIKVQIDADGRASVTKLESENSGVDFDVDAGPMFMGAGA